MLDSIQMNDFDVLPFELRKLGLTEREAKFYLACLELGQSTAYEIAKKMRTSRPTVYRILKSLEKKKLVSQGKSKNKNYFTASSPEELLSILKIKRREAEEQEREFLRIISALQTKYSSKNKCGIKIHKGPKSHKGLLETFSTTPAKEINIIFIGKNHSNLEKEYLKINKRLRNIKIREVYFGSQSGSSELDYVEQRFLNITPDSKHSMTIILADKTTILKKNMGLYIENENMRDVFDLLFLSLWR